MNKNWATSFHFTLKCRGIRSHVIQMWSLMLISKLVIGKSSFSESKYIEILLYNICINLCYRICIWSVVHFLQIFHRFTSRYRDVTFDHMMFKETVWRLPYKWSNRHTSITCRTSSFSGKQTMTWILLSVAVVPRHWMRVAWNSLAIFTSSGSSSVYGPACHAIVPYNECGAIVVNDYRLAVTSDI